MRHARLLTALLVALSTAPLACDSGAEATQVPDSATTTVISLRGIDCEDCGTDIIAKLREHDGIYTMTFDRVRAELTVQHDAARIDVGKLLEVAGSLGHEAIAGAGQGQYLPGVAFDPAFDVVEIAEAGEVVELEPHLVAGKVTVFDFYAIWCEPCREVDEHMLELLAANPDVALRKINIVDWDSEVAKQHLRNAASLPYLLVYGPDGRKQATITGLDVEQLDAAIAKARAQ
jgi:thiol-disulfide isomerase/thioredoxin